MASALINYQFNRVFSLIVTDKNGKALDLSALHIKFATKHSDTQTPNTCDVRVYNMDLTMAATIKKEFKTVIMQAGYEGNFGIIFKGGIKQVILGRENATDTFIDIIGGDGDQAYNFAIVNKSLEKGSTLSDHLSVATKSMQAYGVNSGFTSNLPETKLPRGKVMYGNSKDYLRSMGDANGFSWSIQNEQLNFLKQTTYLPGTAVVLTSKTGLIGTPQQTDQGVNVKALINPKIKCGGRIQINNAGVELVKINQSIAGSPANTPPALSLDGFYYVLTTEYLGDTRGNDWYVNLVGITIKVTTNPLNSVAATYGP